MLQLELIRLTLMILLLLTPLQLHWILPLLRLRLLSLQPRLPSLKRSLPLLHLLQPPVCSSMSQLGLRHLQLWYLPMVLLQTRSETVNGLQCWLPLLLLNVVHKGADMTSGTHLHHLPASSHALLPAAPRQRNHPADPQHPKKPCLLPRVVSSIYRPTDRVTAGQLTADLLGTASACPQEGFAQTNRCTAHPQAARHPQQQADTGTSTNVDTVSPQAGAGPCSQPLTGTGSSTVVP